MKHSSLQCHHMPGTHDHSHLSGAISDSLCEWCIDADKDVTAFTTDNGSNVVKAVEEDLDKIRLPCAMHTLNLSVQKAFEVQAVQKAISRSKKVVEHFSKSRPHREELENKQEMLELPKHKLIQVILTEQAYCNMFLCVIHNCVYCISSYTQFQIKHILLNVLTLNLLQGVLHRWNSVYDMIHRLCEQQAAIYAVLHSHRDLLHLERSPEEWKLLEDLCEILEPLRMPQPILVQISILVYLL